MLVCSIFINGRCIIKMHIFLLFRRAQCCFEEDILIRMKDVLSVIE